jgi:hypothetical protein
LAQIESFWPNKETNRIEKATPTRQHVSLIKVNEEKKYQQFRKEVLFSKSLHDTANMEGSKKLKMPTRTRYVMLLSRATCDAIKNNRARI